MYVLVSDLHKVNLWWSAKCGCTYTKYLFYNKILNKNIEYMHNEYPISIYNKNYDNFYICRDPYARILSCFIDKYINGFLTHLYKPISFKQFVDDLYNFYINGNKSYTFDIHHTTPQFSEAYPINDTEFKFKKILKLEEVNDKIILKEIYNMDDDKKEIYNFSVHYVNIQKNKNIHKNVYNIDYDMLTILKNNNLVPNFISFYNEDIKKKIEEIYKIDFEILAKYNIKYDFNIL